MKAVLFQQLKQGSCCDALLGATALVGMLCADVRRMVYVLVPWVSFSVLFCLALLRAAVRPPPDYELHSLETGSDFLAPEALLTSPAAEPTKDKAVGGVQTQPALGTA